MSKLIISKVWVNDCLPLLIDLLSKFFDRFELDSTSTTTQTYRLSSAEYNLVWEDDTVVEVEFIRVNESVALQGRDSWVLKIYSVNGIAVEKNLNLANEAEIFGCDKLKRLPSK